MNFFILLKILSIIVPLLAAVAYFTLAERKILGAIQRRRGPNVVGVYGLLQPLADGFKLLLKETIIPSVSNKFIFVIAPILTFFISLLGWAVIPYTKYSILTDLNLGIIYILTVSSLSIYGILIAGWSSNSKYAFLGALRATAQMISYEISIGFIILTIILCVGSCNLTAVIEAQRNVWFVVPFFPLFLIFWISALAETNRHPFDLPEAEAELVSGYNVEYSAMGFALFSLGEYGSMLLMCSLTVIFFFGGWLPFCTTLFSDFFWFSLKILFFVFVFVWVRAALPRYRYDQLMSIGWKIFLPVSITYLLLTFCILITFNMFPS